MTNDRSLLLIASCVCLPVVLALTGAGGAIAALLMLPLAAQCLRATRRRLLPTVMIAAVAVPALMQLPAWSMPPVAVWCGAAILLMWAAPTDVFRRGIAWAAVCAAGLIAALAVVDRQMAGSLPEGLAAAACDWISRQADAPRLLLRAFQSGLARLDGNQALVPALNFGGSIVMLPETQAALLMSLRTSLRLLLEARLGGWLGTWLTVTPVLCAVVPELIRPHALRELPPLEEWFLPKGWGAAIGALAAGYTASWLGAEGVWLYMGQVTAAVFAMIYGIQGFCSLYAGGREMDAGPWLQALRLGAYLLLFPFIYVIVGVIDQVSDPRGLRQPPEE